MKAQGLPILIIYARSLQIINRKTLRQTPNGIIEKLNDATHEDEKK